MLNRRIFLGGLSASTGLPLLLMPGALDAQGRPAHRLHAMIVGINVYTGLDATGQPVQHLKGAQNDAAAIEREVKRFRPATLIRLGWDAATGTEQPVTRADFFRAWEQTLGAARSGDRLLLTFAGHGTRVPVLPGNPSEESDGYDDTLVFTRWNAKDGRNAEHIIDDELRELFEAADRKGVIVCFVADSCHSGTLTRNVSPLAGDKTYRFVRHLPAPAPTGPAAARKAPAPGTARLDLPPNMVFLAGALETQTVPEIRDPRTGQHHGALSLAFARALAPDGAARSGAITVYDLQAYVLRNARLLSDGVQTASRRPTRVAAHSVTDDTQLFVLPADSTRPDEEPPQASGPTVRLRIVGRGAADAARIVRALRGATLAGAGEAEALSWDGESRLVLNSQGHRIAEGVAESGLQSVVDCRAALDRLMQMAARGLDVQVLIGGRDTPASDATHKPGDLLEVKISGLAIGDYLTVFNLAGNGVVQMLEPTPYQGRNPRPNFKRPHFDTGMPVDRPQWPLPDVHVRQPFGADHLIAVAARQPMRLLMPALRAAHDLPDAANVMAALANESRAQTLRIGLRGIYTWRS